MWCVLSTVVCSFAGARACCACWCRTCWCKSFSKSNSSERSPSVLLTPPMTASSTLVIIATTITPSLSQTDCISTVRWLVRKTSAENGKKEWHDFRTKKNSQRIFSCQNFVLRLFFVRRKLFTTLAVRLWLLVVVL